LLLLLLPACSFHKEEPGVDLSHLPSSDDVAPKIVAQLEAA